MKKEYQKPEADIISLISDEKITDALAEGSMSLEDSIIPKPQ